VSALDLIERIHAAGGVLLSEGDRLRVRAPQPLPDTMMAEIRKNKPLLLALANAEATYGVTLAELRTAAGDDWGQFERDPALLLILADMIATRRLREKGIAPPSYTATTTCAHCGPVSIWPGCPPKVAGCPWCFNRAAGRPVPRR